MTDYLRDDGATAEPDVNTTPLIDVLLVLLVMLIVTIPLPPRGLDSTLPTDSPPRETPLPPVTIALAADGSLSWNEQPVADLAALETHLRTAAALRPAPSLVVRPAATVPYGQVIAVVAAAHRQGLTALAIAPS